MSERVEVVAAGLARMTTRDAYERLVDHEIPVAPILSHPEVLVDPQITHNGALVEAEHPVYGRYRRVRPAARFSETKFALSKAAPLYSEDADSILEELGIDTAGREALRERGVVAKS